MTGQDEAGVSVVLDSWPVVPAGEIAAIQAGHATYQIRAGLIEWRGPEMILSDRRPEMVLVAHCCTHELPGKHRAKSGTAIPIEKIVSGECPF